MLYSFSAANFAGSSKRCELSLLYPKFLLDARNTDITLETALVNALLLVAFSLGNLAGTQVFQAKDAPQYLPGKISLLVLLLVLFPSALVMHLHIKSVNTAKAENVARLVAENGWTEEELQREKDRYAFLDLVSNPLSFVCGLG